MTTSYESMGADVTSTADIIDLDAYRARRQRNTATRAASDGAEKAVLPMVWSWWFWAFVWVPVPVGSTGPAWQQG